MRHKEGCVKLDHKKRENNGRNQDKTCVRIHKQRQNWKDHINKMDKSRIPIQVLQYMPWDRRSTGHQAKRWLETITRPHDVTEVWKMMTIKLSIVYLPIISGLL
jgi:hypothetical protein